MAAAERGDAHALFALGLIHATGRLVEADPVAAHMWFNLAARCGLAEAAEERRLLAQEMTPAEVARAQRLAREWLESHGLPAAVAQAA
ncbi:MAG: sel1 repeat family protein [Alphaproteobacteria bacterium]|nr:MAG: sel1 repeat family protein [Alphaproteobacteria bacterium]